MVLLSYALGWVDLIGNEELTESWWENVKKSFSYYIGWVLPYWWLLIIIGTFSIGSIILLVQFILQKLMK